MFDKPKFVLRNIAILPKVFSAVRPMFSQFGEDVALARLLRPQSSGTYVDVGANHPFNGSNTAYLYLKGWHGLAIDPNPKFAGFYKRQRPRDIYLAEGASASAGCLNYYEFSDDKYNTFSDDRANQLTREGHPVSRQRSIPCRPLAEMIQSNLNGKHIDLLSVDCEGFDLAVLQSANLQTLKPTVLVVEDFQQYCGFRDGNEKGELYAFLRMVGYAPIYQCAWSSIYVSTDWRDLPQTGAFRPPASLDDYMPKPLGI